MNNRILICSCCGKGVPDSEEHNVSFRMVPYPHDNGRGMCTECGGDKNATDIKKRLGFAMCAFCEARFDVVRSSLSAEKQIIWDESSYEQKCLFINKIIEKGILKW